jgi:DNA-binding transcriptional ArsR family regulator
MLYVIFATNLNQSAGLHLRCIVINDILEYFVLLNAMRPELLESAQTQADLCSVFGNPSRVLIVWTLGESELSVGDIATAIDRSLQNTSQHLHLMKDKGLLTARREGNTIYYRVKREGCPANCCLLQIATNQPSAYSTDQISTKLNQEANS